MKNLQKYSNLIKQEAERLGFDSCGIAKAAFLEEEARHFEQWLARGYHGKMQYMENHFDKRLDPRLLVPGAQSVISLGYNYFPESPQKTDTYKIAKYAYGKDYHQVLRSKLRGLLHFIETTIGAVAGRVFVDSAPVMERTWAQRAGLGWLGKHRLLIQKDKGSFFFLAVLILDLELAYDLPFKTDHCGTCTRCIDACPTDALLSNKLMDAGKCISYFTIELKEGLPADMKGKFEDWMFGCDICQDVCPWNRFSTSHAEPDFVPHPDLLAMGKEDWKELTAAVFRDVFRKSAVKRTKFSGLQRNIAFLAKKGGVSEG